MCKNAVYRQEEMEAFLLRQFLKEHSKERTSE